MSGYALTERDLGQFQKQHSSKGEAMSSTTELTCRVWGGLCLWGLRRKGPRLSAAWVGVGGEKFPRFGICLKLSRLTVFITFYLNPLSTSLLLINGEPGFILLRRAGSKALWLLNVRSNQSCLCIIWVCAVRSIFGPGPQFCLGSVRTDGHTVYLVTCSSSPDP